MMIRKIQKIGNSYYIALPQDWIKNFNLSKSSEVEVRVSNNGELILIPSGIKRGGKEANLEYDESIERKILSYYLMGYNTIRILNKESFKPEQREIVLKIARKLSGLEIVDESSNLIVLQSLIDEGSLDPITILFRINSISSTMYLDSIKLTTKDEKILSVIIERDEEVDRLYFLLVRQLRSLLINPSLLSKLGLSLVDCLDLRIASHFLEKIGDEAVKLAEYLSLNRGRINEKLLNTLQDIAIKLSILQEKALIYFIKKKTEINVVKNDFKKLYEDFENLSNKVESYEIPLLNIFKNIIEFNIDICDLTTYL